MNGFTLRGFIFRDIPQKKIRKESSNSGSENTTNVGGKHTRARAPLARKYTNGISSQKMAQQV